ncbi:unnamed protein product, partial [Rotaria magnacalcarata]
MSTKSIIILLIGLFLCTRIQSQQAFREYVAKKDFFNGLKSGEFSIYDQSNRNLLFRLESRYGFLQKAELFAYPQRQIVGSIKNNFVMWLYDADIQIFDMFYNQWIPGKITQAFPQFFFRYNIQYGNRRLLLQ